jgi:ABC-type glutathione transport system ATPase component
VSSDGQAVAAALLGACEMENLLQVRHLTAEFRSGDAPAHRAVDGVSFDVASGEVVGVMGESGCGKTTLALALLGVHEKERVTVSGSAVFRDVDLLALGESALRKIRGAKISLISQEPGVALCPVRRVGEQIAEVLHAHSAKSWKECRADAESWLVRVGLEPAPRIFAAYPHQLSGGQLQRVVLAQSLICRPDLLIADEPTASLDARHQAEFIKLLRELKSQLGLAVLLISHTPEIQASLADRILVMKIGRIVEQGPLLKVFRHPSDEYTRSLINSAMHVNTSHQPNVVTAARSNRSEEAVRQ